MSQALLNTPTPEIETPEAAGSRFFVAPIFVRRLELVRAPETRSLQKVLSGQKDLARTALDTLLKITESRDVVGTADVYPDLYADQEVATAKSHISDQGTIWRRTTDKISHNIAKALPNQILSDTPDAFHYSDARKLYRVGFLDDDNGKLQEIETSAYTSFMEQSEYNLGMKIATEAMWHELLTHIILSQ